MNCNILKQYVAQTKSARGSLALAASEPITLGVIYWEGSLVLAFPIIFDSPFRLPICVVVPASMDGGLVHVAGALCPRGQLQHMGGAEG